MGLETATYIHELDPTNPVGGSDPKSQGDDHIRLTKQTLQNTLPNIEGVVNASHTELNILDGATLSTAELNILDGATLSTAELNILDGVTSTASELNALDGITVSAAQLNSAVSAASQLATGLYTPAGTALGNCAFTSAAEHTYGRCISLVTVIGRATVNVTSAGVVTFAIALPIASDFTADQQLVGNGGTGNSGEQALVTGDVANNRAIVSFNTSSTGSKMIYYSFSYRLL